MPRSRFVQLILSRLLKDESERVWEILPSVCWRSRQEPSPRPWDDEKLALPNLMVHPSFDAPSSPAKDPPTLTLPPAPAARGAGGCGSSRPPSPPRGGGGGGGGGSIAATPPRKSNDSPRETMASVGAVAPPTTSSLSSGRGLG